MGLGLATDGLETSGLELGCFYLNENTLITKVFFYFSLNSESSSSLKALFVVFPTSVVILVYYSGVTRGWGAVLHRPGPRRGGGPMSTRAVFLCCLL